MDPSDPLSKTLTTLSKGGRLSVPKGKNKQQRTSRNLSPLPCARFNIYKIFEAWHTWPRKSAAKIKIERVNRWKGPNFTREGEYRCIFERKREREGGEKEGPGKFGLSLEEERGSEKRRSEIWKGTKRKKRGPTRLNRPTLEKLAATCQPPPWPYVPYFSPLFNPGTIFQPGLERKRKGKEESRFCFFDRGRRWKFFYFNWSKNFAFKSWRIMETFIFLREIFFFQKKLQYFKFDSAT